MDLHSNTRNAAGRRLESLASQSAHEHLLFDAAFEIYTAYQGRLEEQNLLDFNDLIYCAYTLAKTDRSLRNRFDYILVDEFQDTNTAQYTLLRLLAADLPDLFAVGDPDQSIYRWRGADYRNVQRFQKDFPQAELIPFDKGEFSPALHSSRLNTLISILETPESIIITTPVGLMQKLESAQEIKAQIEVAIDVPQRLNHLWNACNVREPTDVD